MTEDEKTVLIACQALCLLLGTEALMRLEESLTTEDLGPSTGRYQWLIAQRRHLAPLLEILGKEKTP